MKLSISLHDGRGAVPFHPGDQVLGELEIRDRVFKTPPTITATFKGRLRLAMWPRDNMPVQYAMHTLFEQSKLINIRSSNGASDTEPPSDRYDEQSQPAYSAPFEFTFPAASKCCCCCQLPPTLYSTSSSVRIRVEYMVVISVSQRMMCHIRRTKTVQRPLSLRSEPELSIFPESSIGSLPADKLCPRLNDALQDVETSFWRNPDWLPRYTPSVQIEVLLPSPPILTTRGSTPMQIILYVPQELIESERIYLRSILVELKTSVSAILGATCGTCTETVECWSSRGRVLVDKQRFELDSGMWGSSIRLDARPTCKSCVLDLIHSVDVTANISRGNEEELQPIRASIKALVMDPPPRYVPESLGGW